MTDHLKVDGYATETPGRRVLPRISDAALICLLSVSLAVIGTAAAYFLLGAPALIGIDDANITMIYGRNIAAGHGYVYTPGFERVEGSTSLLWTSINAAAYSITPRPELLLLGISVLLTAGGLSFALRGFDLLFRIAGISRIWGFAFATVFLISLFGFYAWNALTLMDLTVWSFTILGLSYTVLCRVLEGMPNANFAWRVAAFSTLMVLARPEAMVLTPAILLLGVLAEKDLSGTPRETLRAYGPGLFAAASTAAGLAIFRVIYFGVPFPNTYYAKVSENFPNNVLGGFKYFFNFLFNGIYSEIYVFGVLFSFFYFYWRSFSGDLNQPPRRVDRGLFFLSAVICLFLSIQFVTGGDQFGSFRFYQPVYPWFFAPVFVGALVLLRPIQIFSGMPDRLRILLFATFAVAHLAACTVQFHFLSGLNNEFGVADRGRAVGEALTHLRKRGVEFTVGSISAGGIGLTFEGRLLDLMGLNWPEMSRAAKPRGYLAGHGAFDDAVFWVHRPELVVPSLVDAAPQPITINWTIQAALKGMPHDKDFRSAYLPVSIPVAGQYIVAFARRDWIRTYALTLKIRTAAWDAVRFE